MFTLGNRFCEDKYSKAKSIFEITRARTRTHTRTHAHTHAHTHTHMHTGKCKCMSVYATVAPTLCWGHNLFVLGKGEGSAITWV